MNKKTLLRIPHKESGLTLVEIMVAMVLGLILVGGILQVFAGSRQTYQVHDAVSRMQESGRMALEVISRDIRMADFWGCASDSTNVVSHLNTGGAGFVNFAAGGIAGRNSAGGLPGTDELTLRGGASNGIPLLAPYGPTTSGALTTATGTDVAQNDFMMISDCTNADVFQVTNATPSTSGSIAHVTGGAAPGNVNAFDPTCVGANAHCLSKIYDASASIFSAQEVIYTIGNGAQQPALFRNGVELIDGIENFQVLYGEDTDPVGSAGFGIANYYVPANQVVNMGNVISIRFAVVTRSYDDNIIDGVVPAHTVLGTSITPTDTRLRQVYTTTVNVRNRL